MGEVILSSALYSVTLCILRLGIYISQKKLSCLDSSDHMKMFLRSLERVIDSGLLNR